MRGRGITCSVGNFNHRKCATDFAKHRIPNQNVTEIVQSSSSIPGLGSNNPAFDFSTNCFLCTGGVTLTFVTDRAWKVKRNRMKKVFEDIAKSRSDEWGDKVMRRMQTVFDLKAVGVIYHGMCSINFRTGRGIPEKFSNSPKRVSAGRPPDLEKLDSFHNALDWWENSNRDCVSLAELVEKLQRRILCT